MLLTEHIVTERRHGMEIERIEFEINCPECGYRRTLQGEEDVNRAHWDQCPVCEKEEQ